MKAGKGYQLMERRKSGRGTIDDDQKKKNWNSITRQGSRGEGGYESSVRIEEKWGWMILVWTELWENEEEETRDLNWAMNE